MAYPTQHLADDSSFRHRQLALCTCQLVPRLPHGIPRWSTSTPRRMATHREDHRGAQRATPSPSTRDSGPDTDQKPTSSSPVTRPREQQRTLATTSLDNCHPFRGHTNVARIHCPCVELRPTTLGPVTHSQSAQWQLWHTQPIQQHHFDQDCRQSMAHTPTVQPTRIYPTPKDGNLSTDPWTSTSPEPWSQQQLPTHNHVPTALVHITVVLQLSAQHGPTTERTILKSSFTMARSTGGTSLHGGKPHPRLPWEPSLHGPSQTILGCDHTDIVPSFSLPEPTVQASCNELTLAPHNGPRFHETGILSLSPLPRDLQTIFQHVLQQEHRPTCPRPNNALW